MNNTLSTFIVTIVTKQLTALERILAKADAHSKEKGISQESMLAWQLYPDMLNFKKQIQVATDDARRNLYLLAGKEHIKFEDSETTFVQLQERVIKTKELIGKLTASDFERSDARHISLYWMGGAYVEGKDFIHEFVIQNVSFHVVTAYDILRANGVSIGKADYTGALSMNAKQ